MYTQIQLHIVTYQERPRDRPDDVQQPLVSYKEGANSYRVIFILKDKLKQFFGASFIDERGAFYFIEVRKKNIRFSKI
jgi:hypothetical protein